jgi:membrane protease YdiL (CAAX protease family)
LKTKHSTLELIIAVIGVFACVIGLSMFIKHLLMNLKLPTRMILMIITQWLLFIVPGILMLKNRESIFDLGFDRKNVLKQILIGIILGVLLSLVFTVLPIQLGFKEMVGNSSYTKAWQFTYEFVYAIVGVALVEELIFRGYIFHKLLEIKNSRW